MKPCPFCNLDPERIVSSDHRGIVFRDGYPVTEGHSLIIPREHVGSLLELHPDVLQGLFGLALQTAETLREEDPTIAGFNIGVNIGEAAGQTVPHVHIHVIPRRAGDMDDPRGGVRGVIPEKQKY